MSRISILIYSFLFLIFTTSVSSSRGDRSTYYSKCVDSCTGESCTKDKRNFLYSTEKSLFIQYFWSCKDDCRYECMWDTVDLFEKRQWEVPQFYGKWPFIRIFGLQEAASVLFSIFNFLAHFVMLQRFRRDVWKNSPFYTLWQVYGFICLNGWIWSALFHARDIPLTERMDYFSAFSMILFNFYAMTLRMLRNRSRFLALASTLFCSLFFIHHVTYLGFVVFDYGYNMVANIVVATVTIISWLVWCIVVRRQQPYVWRCALFFLLTTLSAALEVLDFPPLFWLIDAHALFHLSTSALPFLFYKFVIDDCRYLHKQEELARDETFRKRQ